VTLNTYNHVVEGMQALSAQIRRWTAEVQERLGRDLEVPLMLAAAHQ